MERLRQRYRRGHSWLLVAWLIATLVASPAMAGPRGGTVIAGDAQITMPDVNTTHIQQTSQRVFIDFASYDVGVDESVVYSQPGQSAIAVNRILDQKPSEIFGTLKADGTIFLVNTRGIIFGESATLDVGGLVASGLSISLDDFLNGEYRFEDVSGGLVVNRGLIQAATGGSVTLLGAGVANHGLIEAELGAVSMAAGSRAHLTFDMDGLIGVEIDQGVTQALPELEALVSNHGRISADGGRVVLTGATASGLFDIAVNNQGVIEAGRIERRGGKVILTGSGADVVVGGTIDVSARDESGAGMIRIESDALALVNDAELVALSSVGLGGDVQVLGDRVGLTGNTRVDASGGAGGGNINVGGSLRGEGPLPNASRTLVGADVSVLANALVDGDGGQIVVWSDEATLFQGSLAARGAGSGSGGFAEISSLNSLASSGAYDLSADSGNVGTLLFDPLNIEITGGTNDGSDDTDTSDTALIHDSGSSTSGTIAFLDEGSGTPNPFVIYESEIETTGSSGGGNANIVLEARNSITAVGDFAGDDLAVDNSLTLRTQNEVGGGGIDLTNSSDLGNLTISVGGALTVETGTGSSPLAAPIALPKVSVTGVQTVSATGTVTIGDLNQPTNSALTVQKAGNVTINDATNGLTIDAIGSISAVGDVSITSTGSILPDSAGSAGIDSSGSVSLIAGGSIGETKGSRTLDVSTTDLTLDTGGAYHVDASGSTLNSLSLTVDQAGIDLNSSLSADNISFENIGTSGGDVTFDLTAVTSSLDLTFAADSGVQLGSVDTLGGSIAVSADGTIDATTGDTSADLTGAAVSLTSTTDADIGAVNPLDVVSTSLSADGGNVTLDLTEDTDGTTLTSVAAVGSVVIAADDLLSVGSVTATDDVTITASEITDDVNDLLADITSGTDPGDGVSLTTTGKIGTPANTLDVDTRELTLDVGTTFNVDVPTGTSLTVLDLTLNRAAVSGTSDIGADNFVLDTDFDVRTNGMALDFNNVTSATALDLTANIDTGNLILDVIDTSGGALDMTTPDGNVSIGSVNAGSGSLTLNAFGTLLETIDDSAADVTGGSVTLTSSNNAVVGGASRLDIASTTLTITGGAITIDEASGGELTTLTAAGAVDVRSDGSLTIGAIDAGANTVTLSTSSGGITDKDPPVNRVADLTGSSVTLTAAANVGTLANPLDVNSAGLTLSVGTTFNVDAVDGAGALRALTDLDLTVVQAGIGTTSAIAASNIAMFDVSNAGGAIEIVDVSATGSALNFTLGGDSNLEIGLVSANGGDISLTASGTITEGTDDALVADLVGGAVSLTSTTDQLIGGTDRLDISSSSLSIDGGAITVADIGGTELTALDAVGAIDVTSDSALSIESVIASGTVSLQATALTEATNDTLADVTGSAVDLTTSGSIGSASALDVNTTDLTLDVGGTFQVVTTTGVDLASLDLTVDVASFDSSSLAADNLAFTISSNGTHSTLTQVDDSTGLAFGFTVDSGDILIGGIDVGAGSVTLTTGFGAINDAGDNIALDITGGAVTLSATDEIGGTAPGSSNDVRQALEISSTSLVASGSSLVITETDSGGTTLSDLDATVGGIDVRSNGSLTVADLDAVTTAKLLTTSGSINGGTLSATSLDLDAISGIGNTTALTTDATNISADTTNGAIDIDNSLLTTVSVSSLTTGAGTIDFDQSGGGDLGITTATTGNGAIAISAAAGTLTVGSSISAGDLNDVSLTTTTSGDVELTGTVSAAGDQITISSAGAIDGAGTLTANTVDLDAVTGIGASIALDTVASTLTADTTNGSIDIDNAFAGAVSVGSLTTGTGSITFDQSGGGALNLDSAATGDGSISVAVDEGTLTVGTSVVAGGFGDVALVTTTMGDVELTGFVTASGDQIIVGSAGDIDGAGTLTASTADLDAASGIGATTTLNTAVSIITADTTSGDIKFDQSGGALTVDTATTGNGDIDIDVAGADLTVGTLVQAGSTPSNVSLSTSGGAGNVIVSGNVNALNDLITIDSVGSIEGPGTLTAGSIDLNAASGIGATNPLNTVAATLAADTTGGDIDIDNVLAGAMSATSLTTGIGDISFDHTGGDLGLTTVSTTDGSVTLAADGGDLTFNAPIAPGGTGNLTLRTTTSGDVLLTQTLTATGDQITINAVGKINGTALLSAGVVDLDAGSGIGDVASINTATPVITADTGTGNIVINNNLAALTTATSLTSGGTGGITFGQSGGGALTVDTATTADGDIGISVDGAAGVALTVSTEITAGATHDVSLTTLTSGDITLNGAVTASDQITVTSMGAVDGSGLLSAAVLDLNAVSGIGAPTFNTAAATISADTTNGAIDLDNALATAVEVQSLTTGAGAIDFDQSGGGAVTFTSVSNGSGIITLGSDADILIGDIDAADALNNNDSVIVTTIAAINDAQDDLVADITAPVVVLTASGDVGGVVSGGVNDPAKALEIDATDLTINATNATLGDPSGGISVDVAVTGNLTLTSNGDFLIDNVSAGGDVMLTAVGSINDALDDTDTDVTGVNVTLIAGTGGTGDVGGTVADGNTADPRQALEVASTSLSASGDTLVISDVGGTTLLDLDATGDIDLLSDSDLLIGQVIATTGSLTIDTGGGVFDAADDLVLDLSAGTVTITAVGDVGGTAPPGTVDTRQALEIDADDLSITAAGIVIGEQSGANLLALVAGGAIDLESSGDLVLGALSAGTDLTIISTAGSVSDLSVDTVVDLDAPGTITVSAGSDVGSAGVGQALDFADQAVVSASAGGSINVEGLGDLSLDVSGGGLLTSVSVVGDLTLTSSGADIVAPSSMTVPGILTVNASGNVSLANLDNQFGTVLMSAGGDATVNDVDSFVLGAANVSGDYSIVQFGAVDDAGTLIVGGKLSVDPNGNSVILDEAGNDLGAISVLDTTNLTVVESNSLALDRVQATGDVDLTLVGALTNTGAVSIDGTLSIDTSGANVTLDVAANDFNVVTLTNVGSVTLTDVSAVVLQDSSIGGSLVVDAVGNISAATDVSVGALASFDSGGNVVFASAGNDFSSVQVTSAQDVTLTDINAIDLAGFDITGNLALTAGGSVTDSAPLLIGGNASFETPGSINLNENANDFASVQVIQSVNAFFVDIDDLVLSPSTVTGNLDIRADGDVNLQASSVGGALDLRTNGLVDQGGALSVLGNASFTTGGFDLTLGDAANDFGSVSVRVAQDVVLRDAAALVLDNVSANGNLTVTTGGALTDLGRVRVVGTTNILAGGAGASADVVLDNSANDFATVRVLRGNAVTLVDGSGIDLGNSAVDATFDLTAGGDVTNSGVLVVADQMTVLAGGNDVTLTNAGNDFSIFSGDAVGNLALNDVDDIRLGPTNVFGNFDLAASGTIDAVGRVSVAGVADFSAGGGTLVLDRVAHAFNELRLSGDAANVRDEGALVLGTSNLASDLTLTTAGAISQSGGAGVAGTAAFDAGGNDVRLDSAGNDFGTVTFNNVDDVAVLETNDIVVGDSVIGGTLGITAGGSITDAGVVTVGGVATLSAGTDIAFDGAHDFSQITLTAGQNALIEDINTLTLGVTAVGGDFTLRTADVLTSDLQIGVGGVFAVDVGGTNLVLGNSANDFGVIAMQAGDAFVVDAGDLILGTSAVTGNLTLATGGTITDQAPISVAGTLSLDASGMGVALDSPGNIIGGAVSVANVSNLSLASGADLLLGDVTLSGALNVDAAGNIGQALNTALRVPGTSFFTAVGSIDLIGINDLVGEVRLNTSGPNGDAFVRSNALTLGSSTLSGALGADALGLNLVGDVTALSQDLSNVGPVTVNAGGLVTLQATGDVNLGTSVIDAMDPNLDALAVQSGANVSLGVIGAANPLQSLAITANAITLDGNVTTVGVQSFNGPTSLLASNVAFTATNADFAATLTALGTDVLFNADVSFGGDVSLASLQAGGGVTFSGGNVATTADQSYLGSVVLSAPDGDTLLQGDNLTFSGAIGSPIAGTNALVVQAAGVVSFGSQASVGVGGQTLSRLDVAGNSINLGANRVETTAGQTYRNPFLLGVDATLVNIGTGEVGFLDTLTGSGVESLLIDGNARFDGDVSGLASLTVTGTSTLSAGSIATAGAQSYGSGLLGTDVTLSASDLTFAGTLDSASGQPGSALAVLLTAGTATFAGDVGAQERLGTFSINADASFAGAVLTADADFSVGGTTTLTGSLVSVDTGSGPGDIALADIDGRNNSLSLAAGTGSIFLTGSAVDLDNLSIAGADGVSLGAITALGDVSVTGATTASIDGALDAQNLEVRVDGGYVQNADVTVSSTGGVFVETLQGSLTMAQGTSISGGDVSLVNRDITLDETSTAILVSQIDAVNEIRVGAAQGNILVSAVPVGQSNFSGTVLRIGGDSLVPTSTDIQADLSSLAGDRFGTPDAPPIISITDLVVINSRIASQSTFLLRPDLLTENSLRELSLAQTLEAVGDTQRTTVVQLVLLDPAIFTAVSNVGSEEEPVRLPEDQRVD